MLGQQLPQSHLLIPQQQLGLDLPFGRRAWPPGHVEQDAHEVAARLAVKAWLRNEHGVRRRQEQQRAVAVGGHLGDCSPAYEASVYRHVKHGRTKQCEHHQLEHRIRCRPLHLEAQFGGLATLVQHDLTQLVALGLELAKHLEVHDGAAAWAVDEIAISEAAEDEIAISEAAWAGDGVHGCEGANDAGWTGTIGGGARGDAFGRASGAGASATAHAERALGGAATATLAGALSRRARVAVGRVLGAAAACEAGADVGRVPVLTEAAAGVGRVPVLTEAAAGATYAAPARLVIDSEADDEIAISEADDEIAISEADDEIAISEAEDEPSAACDAPPKGVATPPEVVGVAPPLMPLAAAPLARWKAIARTVDVCACTVHEGLGRSDRRSKMKSSPEVEPSARCTPLEAKARQHRRVEGRPLHGTEPGPHHAFGRWMLDAGDGRDGALHTMHNDFARIARRGHVHLARAPREPSHRRTVAAKRERLCALLQIEDAHHRIAPSGGEVIAWIATAEDAPPDDGCAWSVWKSLPDGSERAIVPSCDAEASTRSLEVQRSAVIGSRCGSNVASGSSPPPPSHKLTSSSLAVAMRGIADMGLPAK
eukprot:jgi/Chrpa1/13692/Chrysochromulina_OHIO_Genome00015228-RA